MEEVSLVPFGVEGEATRSCLIAERTDEAEGALCWLCSWNLQLSRMFTPNSRVGERQGLVRQPRWCGGNYTNPMYEGKIHLTIPDHFYHNKHSHERQENTRNK